MARPNESYRANGAHCVTPPAIRFGAPVRHTPGRGMMARRLAQVSAQPVVIPAAPVDADEARKARERERSAKRRAAAKLAREAANA